MKDHLSSAATIVLTLCAVIVTGLVVRREFFPPSATAEPVVREIENWKEIASAGHIMGRADAAVKIVEFSDFQCPFCSQVQPALQDIREEYPDQVSIIYRHFPLESIHPYAFPAALAAECAGSQGEFAAYHDALFAKQDSIGIRSWGAFAEAAGVADLAAFRRCIEEDQFRDRVEADMEAGGKIGVSATPTFIVNGQMFSGSLPLEEWEKLVQAALSEEGDR